VAETGRIVGERKFLWQGFAVPGLLWLGLLFLTPLYALTAVAMGTLDPIFGSAQPVWNPVQWDPAVFGEVFGKIFGGIYQDAFVNTIVYVAVASILCVLVAYPVAYFLARHAGRWRTVYLVLIIAPFWINYIMRMLAWKNLLEIDGYVNRILQFTGFLDAPRDWLVGHPETVILGLVYGYIPFMILPLFASLERIDESVIEAAKDLGASPRQAFFKVTLPLSKQGILAGAVIVILPMFGDYYTNNLLSGSPRTTMIANHIDSFINSGSGGREGAALTIVLMCFIAALMAYYLSSVAKASREAQQ
jgi:spermidine/putrescine transport system permease protein